MHSYAPPVPRGARYVLRLDDIAPNMRWDHFHRVKTRVERLGIRPLIGVIPDNQDPELRAFAAATDDFWSQMRTLQARGWEIALHGYQHRYASPDGGLLAVNDYGEFAGLPYARQREKLERALDIFAKQGLETDTFMAPGHAYDHATLRALHDVGIRFVTDGYALFPFTRHRLVFVPQVLARPRSLPFGIFTTCLHLNEMGGDRPRAPGVVSRPPPRSIHAVFRGAPVRDRRLVERGPRRGRPARTQHGSAGAKATSPSPAMNPPAPQGPVLVLGDGMRAFLTVVRSLGRAGLRVEAATHRPDRPEFGSRYLAAVHALPAPEEAADPFCDAVLALSRRRGYSLIVPTTDPTLLPIHHDRGRFMAHRVAIPNPAAFEACFDKFATHRLAGRLGFPLPPTVRLEAPTDPTALASTLGLPLVLKPRRSFSRHHLAQKAVVRTAYTPAEVQLHLEDLLAVGPVLAQRTFRGHGVGVGFLASDGVPLVLFQHARVHEPPHGGGSSYRRSEPLDPRLRDLTERFIRETNYTGVGMLEFKRAPSGEVIFIEANGRFWGSLPLAVASGVDFPRYLYALAVFGNHDFPDAYPPGVYARNLRHDARWLAGAMWWPSARRHVPPRGAVQLARDAARLLTGREHSDSFVRDDFWPAVPRGLGAVSPDHPAADPQGAGDRPKTPRRASPRPARPRRGLPGPPLRFSSYARATSAAVRSRRRSPRGWRTAKKTSGRADTIPWRAEPPPRSPSGAHARTTSGSRTIARAPSTPPR